MATASFSQATPPGVPISRLWAAGCRPSARHGGHACRSARRTDSPRSQRIGSALAAEREAASASRTPRTTSPPTTRWRRPRACRTACSATCSTPSTVRGSTPASSAASASAAARPTRPLRRHARFTGARVSGVRLGGLQEAPVPARGAAAAARRRRARPSTQHERGPTTTSADGVDADVGEADPGRPSRGPTARSPATCVGRPRPVVGRQHHREVGQRRFLPCRRDARVQVGEALAGAGAALDQRRPLELRQVGRRQLGVELRDLQAGAGDPLLERVGPLLQVADVDLRAGQAAERGEPVRSRPACARSAPSRRSRRGRRTPPASRTGR